MFVCAPRPLWAGKGKPKAKTKQTTAKILRESRLIPALVFFVEQFEVALLKLSKAIKVRPVLQGSCTCVLECHVCECALSPLFVVPTPRVPTS